MKAQVRGGYSFTYHSKVYKGGDTFEIDDDTYSRLSHLFQIPQQEKIVVKEVSEPIEDETSEEEKEVVPQHRAILSRRNKR